jgi:hypothetical protein
MPLDLNRASMRFSHTVMCGNRLNRWKTMPREVVLSIEMVSLPVGGMITRMACGSTIQRRG